MLQQTQVDRVVPRYLAWLERWPTVAALAAASPADAIREWQGLGYNRRALSLHLARRNGSRPTAGPPILTRLPGIGAYTAAAIRNRARGEDVLPVDTNVQRAPGCPTRSPRAWRRPSWTWAPQSASRVPRCSVCTARRPVPVARRSLRPTRRQGPFEGSFRQRRAEALRVVSKGPRAHADLDPEAIASLERDEARRNGRRGRAPSVVKVRRWKRWP